MSLDIEEAIRAQVEGRRLSGVTFAMDYVQLQFDPPPTINALTPISVRSESGTAISGEVQFRNLLCEQIAKTVISVELHPAESLVLTFEDSSTIALSLRPEHYVCPEAINVYGSNHFFLVV
ncbi:hypothetical protein [Dyella sp. A6]|uniref:hypothetical protein n=1 Tax=Dyella aluminiiresistens TaxID=3069105 RepID=UPI002E78C659|nr:hypothetical protein [Dyella sp. A6]